MDNNDALKTPAEKITANICLNRAKQIASKNSRLWLRLDNMANLFPAIELFAPAPIYRVAVTLYKEIDENILLQALSDVMVRFPYFKVRLKKGFFWSYLEYNKKPLKISRDNLCPCVGINYRENNHYLFKVKAKGCTVSLEILHAMTDGGGAMILLKTLTAQYLRLCGAEILPNKQAGIWDLNEIPRACEFRDSFPLYSNKNIKSLGIKSPAYHFKGKHEGQDKINIIKATTDSKAFNTLAKKYGVSVTEFLTSVYIYSLMKTQQKTKDKKPIRIAVPVNLRNIFPSETMRNFTYFVICEIRPHIGEYTFEEITQQVYHSLRSGLAKKNLTEGFSGNVNSEKNFFVRFLPLRLKHIMLSLIYSKLGENQYSGSMSNLGVIKLPQDMEPYVKGFFCNLAPNSINTTNCGAVSFKDSLVITFTRTVKESVIEKEFFTFLIKQGLKIKVESN